MITEVKLTIAETLWVMFKGHRLQPTDYVLTDNLCYSVN